MLAGTAPLARSIAALAAVALGAACAETNAPPQAPVEYGALSPATAAPDACPLTIDRVRAVIEKTGRGATITLTAPPDQVMLLRARARGVPDTGGILAACPCGTPGGASEAADGAAAAVAGAPPPMTTRVDDIEGGARITVTATDPAGSHAVRALLRSQLGRVHAGDCPTAAAR